MKLIFTTISLIFIFYSVSAGQSLLGVAINYDNDFLKVGVSIFHNRPKKILSDRFSITFDSNLKNGMKAFSSSWMTGYIICIGLDGSTYLPVSKQYWNVSLKPKIGLGLPKYAVLSYGINLYSNGERIWTWSIDLNIPLKKINFKKKTDS